jgi:hypothetical protein
MNETEAYIYVVISDHSTFKLVSQKERLSQQLSSVVRNNIDLQRCSGMKDVRILRVGGKTCRNFQTSRTPIEILAIVPARIFQRHSVNNPTDPHHANFFIPLR